MGGDIICPCLDGCLGFSARLRQVRQGLHRLTLELFLSIDELRYIVDRWRMDYNHYRPHSSLDYMAPVAFAAISFAN